MHIFNPKFCSAILAKGVFQRDMLELEQTHPNLDAAFKSGLHVVRRSDRFWSGLSTDLVIEQALMAHHFNFFFGFYTEFICLN
jgi:hypothetical protein